MTEYLCGLEDPRRFDLLAACVHVAGRLELPVVDVMGDAEAGLASLAELTAAARALPRWTV